MMIHQMDEKRFDQISHTFTQYYGGWHTVTDSMDGVIQTFDILEKLDLLEESVYHDRDYTLANEMLDGIKRRD